jgi:hypothetical protein
MLADREDLYAMCEEYRALGIDYDHDVADRTAGKQTM